MVPRKAVILTFRRREKGIHNYSGAGGGYLHQLYKKCYWKFFKLKVL